MSGTLGGEQEQSILRQEYKVDCFELPRHKPYIFQRTRNNDRVLSTEEKWIDGILSGVKSLCCVKSNEHNRRAVLLICENISDVEKLRKMMQPLSNSDVLRNVYVFDRAYRKSEFQQLEPGDVIIATNIAGRGSDFHTSEELERNGGLHVILCYIPKNERVEKQVR